MITTQAKIRELFWGCYPQFKRHGRRKQNDYPIDVRLSFCGFVDHLNRSGQISDKLAERVTL